MIDISKEFYISSDPPSIKNIVEISGFRLVRNYLNIDASNKTGNIVLIIGDRGLGKSTCLEYCKNYVNKELKKNSYYLNIGLSMNKLLSEDIDNRVNLILGKISSTLSNNKTGDIEKYIGNMENLVDCPHFLFIDNLDRLYSEEDCKFIKHFFKTSDPILKAISKKIAIYISCAPEWAEFLNSKDLSYVNFSNSIQLRPLTAEEIKKLIEKRAISCGYNISDLINDDLLPIIETASKGNSRKVFQFLEKIINTIDEKDLPITRNTFKSILRTDLFDAAIEKLKELSTEPNISWGINQLWRFFDIIQKNSLDVQNNILKIVEAHEKSFIDERKIKLEKQAWRKIAHKTKGNRFVLHSQVRETITKWRKITGIEKEILLTAYTENPFLTSKTDIEDFVDGLRSAVVDMPAVSNIFDDGVGAYLYINSIDDYNKDRRELIELGWTCVTNLMFSLLATQEEELPKNLYQRIHDEGSTEAYDELTNDISDIYIELDKKNLFRSELESIKARYIDINESPELLQYWETSQMEGFKRAVTTSFEGLLGTLQPKNLDRTQKVKIIKQIKRLIRYSEKSNCEFKASLRWDIKEERKNKELEKSVMKTIAAFLNTNGGTLLIGISDNGNSYGIENDILTLEKKNLDGFGQHLVNLTEKYIGSDKSIYLKIDYVRYGGKYVAMISIDKSPYTVFLNDESTGENQFYIRTHNTTRKIDGEELQKYIKNRFK